MPAYEYKQLESTIAQRVKNAIIAIGRGISGALAAFGRLLARRYTIVFVPHSEEKVYNFQLTVLSVFLFLLVTCGIVGTFFWYSVSYIDARSALASTDGRLNDVQASLDQMRDEANILLREARGFENALSGAFSTIGFDSTTQKSSSGDLSSFFNIRETPEGMLQEVDNIRRLSSYLTSATGPIKEIGDMLNSHSSILSEIPSIWPIKGGIGQITMYFGRNEHPFYGGQFYIHKGIDITTNRSGDPVVTTADGQVVTIDYANDFGNYILIKHKHGYYTRYAHLLSSRVRLGQKVQQGEVVGYIGNTGLSTGPHLHYEIRIGSDVIDPYKYMTMRTNNVERQER